MHLTAEERGLLAGESGPAPAFAMEILSDVAEAHGADRFVEISQAHIDGCLYHAPVLLDFANRLLDIDASVRVSTTLNVSSLDLLHPELYRGDRAEESKALMDAHVAMGCEPTWTCAPYQLPSTPSFGQHIAWGESNAIVFANSVIGARTGRYGDFIDLLCALAGRAPLTGFHTDEGRLATVLIDIDVPDEVLDSDIAYPLIGFLIGKLVGQAVPVINGLDQRADQDRLKALGAAAASAGTVGMFHVVGVTPEAPDVETSCGGRQPAERHVFDLGDLSQAKERLSKGSGIVGAVSVGTPHFSLDELRLLAEVSGGRRATIPFYVNTSRDVLAQAADSQVLAAVEAFGATLVTDTCTYITPIMEDVAGDVMTNSGKWAYYAPGNLGVGVIFGSLHDCVESAVAGEHIQTDKWL